MLCAKQKTGGKEKENVDERRKKDFLPRQKERVRGSDTSRFDGKEKTLKTANSCRQAELDRGRAGKVLPTWKD